MRITASTLDEDEFFRVIDWCACSSQIGWAVTADRREERFLIRLNLEDNDPRLNLFIQKIDGHPAWTVHVEPS